jgi:hypothetical protein
MLRATILAIATVAAVSVAALAPASAHWKGGHHGHGWGRGFGGIVVIDDGCYRWVRGVGRVYVCD